MPQLDKYAPYVFTAYGIAGIVLVGLVVWSILRVMQAKKKLDEVEKEESK